MEPAAATSELDCLSPCERLVLKVASVIGRRFSRQILHDVFPAEGERSRLDEVLGALERAGFLDTDSSGPSVEYVFRTASSREEIYGTLLFAQRRQLHRAVAEWYEGVHQDDLRAWYPVLASHWRGADDPAKAVDYFERAANEATRCGALEQAECYLKESLELSTCSGVLSAGFYEEGPEAGCADAA